jgi:signal transduction histidine kinase/BarA-like signal transduction histidine kinase
VDGRAADLARLFEGVPEGVYIGTLQPTASVTLAANPHLKLIFGYPSDAVDEVVRPFDPDRFVDPQARASMLARLAAEGSVTDCLLRLRKLDRTAVWVELTARAQPDGDDGALRIDALVRDVTHRKKLDDQSRDLNAQLLQDEKMAALGQTISGVAHELNNPLATILSWAERLKQLAGVEEPVRRGVETILGESERAARIVRNLLTFARKRQTTRAMVDVNQVVRDTLALRADGLRASEIQVIDALAPEVPRVFADGYQLQQVLLNLVINAEQAMAAARGRGVLRVRTSHHPDQESVTIELTDDGPGIPEEVQGRVFDPFFTTKDVGKGTGLGLTVAYAIVQEHGGSIRLESRAGAGASFFIELPLIGAARASPAARTQPPAPIAAAAGAAILVVEDETALAAAVIEMLQDAGYAVEHAGNGEEALARVKARAFDLVICDLKMPRVDGKMFYRALATRAPALARRVIFVTGDVAGTEAERFLSDSGCRWLAKPFRSADLLRSVRDALA